MMDHCEYWRMWELEFHLLPQQNLVSLCLFIYFWLSTLTFTKPFKLNKIPLLQLSPYRTFLSQLSSRCTHPHPLLTRHAHTPVTLSSSVRNPDCLATVLLYPHKQFNWGCHQHSSRCDILADAGFLCQYSMHRDRVKGTLCIKLVKLERWPGQWKEPQNR